MRTKLRPLVLATVLWGLFFGLLVFTNPQSAPLVLLMVPFIVLLAALYVTNKFLLHHLLPNISVRRQKVVAISLALPVVVLLVLSSVQQLTWRDLLLFGVLVSLGLFYTRRSHLLKQ